MPFAQAESPNLPAAVRAIEALEKAIREPIGMFNRQVSGNERECWEPVFLPIIERLGQLGADPYRDPAIRLAIREALEWHASHSETATSQAARTALARLGSTVDDDLAACLDDG